MNMATGAKWPIHWDEYFSCLCNSISNGGTEVIRNLFDQKLNGVPLDVVLAKEKNKIKVLRQKKMISKDEYDLLYPPCGQPPNSKNYNFSLLIHLLRNLPSLGLNHMFAWNVPPDPSDLSIEADLYRLVQLRNKIEHSPKIEVSVFWRMWTETEQVLFRLNSALRNPLSNLYQTIDSYKNDPLDLAREQKSKTVTALMTEQDVRNITQDSDMMTDLGFSKEDVSSTKKDVKDIKQDMSYAKHHEDVIEKDMNSLIQASIIPAEILRMDKNSVKLYKQALSEGKEAVYNIRVMIVGHYGVGKTTLRKRMLGEDVDIHKRKSTDGIDVHVKRCRVSRDTGQWTIIEKDERTKMVCHRLIKLLQTSNTSKETIDRNKEVETEAVILESEDVDESFRSGANRELSNDHETDSTERVKADFDLDGNQQKVKTEEPREEYILNRLKELIEEIKRHKIDNIESNTADLSVWDFAGQFVFYATHQVFLSRRAIYLLVSDISKDVQDVVEDDDCFVDSRGANNWKISEFVDFWLNSIHEFCNSPGDEGPPVILVGTFADKLNAAKNEYAEDDFFYKLRCTLKDKATFCHLIDEDFAIDNSVADGNVEMLKTKILETVSKQNYWGELIPAKWITLEGILATLKDDGLKVLGKDKLRDLNKTSEVPIESKEELELFLKFHHESGNILYFSDEKLQDSIILDPQWLIDAFKSLITAKMFCCRKRKIFQKWHQFDQSAILTYELVEAVWEQKENSAFHEHKELVLNYLEKLSLIAKPQHSNSDEVADFYFVPCILKTPPPDDILESSSCQNRRSTSKLCFKTPSGYLPMVVFNKVLAACIHKWRLSKRNGKPTIFCGCGIFDLQDNHTLYIYFYDHVIQIWLTKLSTSDQEPDRNLCSRVKSFVLDLLQNRFGMMSSIDVYVKCQTSDLRSSEDVYAIDKIARKCEVKCSCRNEQHALRVQDLLKYWQVDRFPEIQMDMSRVLTEKDLSRISQAIGSGWQHLGAELGISPAQMDQICLDHQQTSMSIYYMLLKWCSQDPLEATVNTLYNAMKNCTALTFDEKTVESVFAGI